MLSFLCKTLKDIRNCRSGNALVMTALGMPALIGAAGYGVDTAQWYMWKRELQHSVDQAAIAGAWAIAYDSDAAKDPGDDNGNSPKAVYQIRAEQDFLANQDKTADFDSAPNISLASYDGGTENSVLVSATVTRTLPFSSFLTNSGVTIQAVAQAAFEEGRDFNACLITLKDDGTSFEVGGNATVNANCGLGALSCSDDSIVIDGSAEVTTTSIATCGTANVPSANEDAVSEGVSGLEDIYSSTPIPEPSDSTLGQTYSCPKKGDKSAYPQPGVYNGGITVKCNTYFQPGIFYIDGGTWDLTHNAEVTGFGVMFVLRKGATLKLGGSGTNGSVNLTPMQAADFVGSDYASDADKLADMLFIEDKGDESEPVEHTINGNSKFKIAGVVYLPNGNVKINGGAGMAHDLCFQVSAWTLNILGNAKLKTICDYDDSSELGGGTPGVRLIA